MIADGQPSFAEEVARRIRSAAKAGRFNASSLGREVGASTSAAALYWSGERPWPLELLPKVSRALGIGLEFLLTGDNLVLETGAGRSTANADASAGASETRLPYRPQEPVPKFGAPFPDRSPDLVPVREIDLSFGMGATYLDVPVTEEVHHFPRAWLRRYTRSAPEKLFFAQGIGDSMQTTLYDSDLLLIDTAQNQLTSSDRIWVITYANCGSIRRLRPMPDGSVALMADNPSIPREVAYDGELNIVGRVVAYQRKL